MPLVVTKDSNNNITNMTYKKPDDMYYKNINILKSELRNLKIAGINIYNEALKEFKKTNNIDNSYKEPTDLINIHVEYQTKKYDKISTDIDKGAWYYTAKLSYGTENKITSFKKDNFEKLIEKNGNFSDILTLYKDEEGIQKKFDVTTEFKKIGDELIFNYLDKIKSSEPILSKFVELYKSENFIVEDGYLSKSNSVIYNSKHISDDYNDMIIQFSKFVDLYLSQHKVTTDNVEGLFYNGRGIRSYAVNSFLLHKILRDKLPKIDDLVPIIKANSSINWNTKGYEGISKNSTFDDASTGYLIWKGSDKSLQNYWNDPFLKTKVVKNGSAYTLQLTNSLENTEIIKFPEHFNLFDCDKKSKMINNFGLVSDIQTSIKNTNSKAIDLMQGNEYKTENSRIFTLNPFNIGCRGNRGRDDSAVCGCGTRGGYPNKDIYSYILNFHSYYNTNNIRKTGLNKQNNNWFDLIPYKTNWWSEYKFVVGPEIGSRTPQGWNDEYFEYIVNKNTCATDDMDFYNRDNFEFEYFADICRNDFNEDPTYSVPANIGIRHISKHDDDIGYTGNCSHIPNGGKTKILWCKVNYKLVLGWEDASNLDRYEKGWYSPEYKALFYYGYNWYFKKATLCEVEATNGLVGSKLYLTEPTIKTDLNPYAFNFVTVNNDILCVDDRMAHVYRTILNNNINEIAKELTIEMNNLFEEQPELLIPFRLKSYLNYVHNKHTKGNGIYTNIESPLLPGVISVEKPLLLPHLTYVANKDIKFKTEKTTHGYQIINFEEQTKSGFDTLYTSLGEDFASASDNGLLALVIPNNSNPCDYINKNPINITQSDEKDFQNFNGDGNGLVFKTKPLTKTTTYTSDEELDEALKRSNALGSIILSLPMVKVEEKPTYMKLFYTTKGDKVEMLKYTKNNYSTNVSETTFEGDTKSLLITKNCIKDTLTLPTPLRSKYKNDTSITGL